jgi:hypothetical protein
MRTLHKEVRDRIAMTAAAALACGLVFLFPIAPSASASPVIAAAGDIACDTTSEFYNGGAGVEGHCRQRATSDLLVQLGLSAVLAVGDTQYHVGGLSDYMQVFDPTWGRLKPIIHPAAGDHEYGTASARGYFDYFNGVGKQSGPAGDRDKAYYSFDVGAWHLIALNTACDRVDRGLAPNGCKEDSPQERWLRSDLAAHRSACTLAFWHSPRFNSGYRGNSPVSQPFWDVLYEAGADVILNGDAHSYERFAPQNPEGQIDGARGMREFIVGTGGAFFTGWSKLKANSEVRQNDTFGVLALALHPGSFEWRFHPEAGKTFTDYGAGACHGRNPGFAAPAPLTPKSPARRPCTIRGTNGKDRLIGTRRKDVICGRGGNDTIRGLGGNDVIRAGAGRDRVFGGTGNDRLYGNGGNDRVRGQSGRDRLVGGSGRDRLYGDRGNDSISARDGGGRDRVFGGKGRDTARVDRADRTRFVERVSRR